MDGLESRLRRGLRRAAAASLASAALLCGTAWGAGAAGVPALFDRPVVLIGTLGDREIQAKVRPKAAPEIGIEGEYFLFGHSQTILLAGETDEDQVFMEESANGTDVSGQWEGTREGDTFRGTWRSADGETLPFMLKEIRIGETPREQ